MTFPTLPRDENTAHSYVSGLTSEQITDLILGCESAILAVEEFAELHNFRDDESYLSNACYEYLVSRWRPVREL